MGAIGDEAALPVLRIHLTHENPAIRETCEIAVDKIEYDNSEEGRKAEPKCVPCSSILPYDPLTFASTSQYPCIDPAPAASHSPLVTAAHSAALSSSTAVLSIPELEATLLDTKLSLFERYRAMFALRNDGSRDAVLALAKGFEDESALFRSVSLSVLSLFFLSELQKSAQVRPGCC